MAVTRDSPEAAAKWRCDCRGKLHYPCIMLLRNFVFRCWLLLMIEVFCSTTRGGSQMLMRLPRQVALFTYSWTSMMEVSLNVLILQFAGCTWSTRTVMAMMQMLYLDWHRNRVLLIFLINAYDTQCSYFHKYFRIAWGRRNVGQLRHDVERLVLKLTWIRWYWFVFWHYVWKN